jgi:hypothetical protein
LFPNNAVTWPVVIGGLGYGWLWDRVAKLPAHVDAAPGHRPPIYFLTGDLERLWAVLHVMDWRELLAEQRLPIFAGPDAVDQLKAALLEDPTWPKPKACLCIEQPLWEKQNFTQWMQSVSARAEQGLADIHSKLESLYAGRSSDAWINKSRSGGLRILGITSRYTTFLQHSMRDWLAGMQRLGHETKLLIEPADHIMLGSFGYAKGILDFKPDLIVLIDHYRTELGKIPAALPTVMWVQDRLQNIYSALGGSSQQDRDYCLGFGRLHLSSKYGYPARRFLSSIVGVNEQRFEQTELTSNDLQRFGCDVSYVSHASAPANRLLREHIQKNLPTAAKLFDDMYQQMEAWYAAGGICLSEPALSQMLTGSMTCTATFLDDVAFAEVVQFFNQSINNAMFRHQTLQWLAELDLNLHIWGNGWEKHPALARYARGVADNQADLRKIYLASRINIQVTPHGVVHQRLLDGLAAGGFFLLRWHPGDQVGALYRQLLEWCQAHEILNDIDLHARADGPMRKLIAQMDALETCTPQTRSFPTFDVMQGHADMRFLNTAAAIWPEYDQVAFKDRQDLAAKVGRFLNDPPARQQIVGSMRRVVIEQCSYRSISQRLLAMIADDLAQVKIRSAA